MPKYDAVVVGARCGGSIVAGLLARAGWSVLLVDKARFPSDTISTHMMFPNTLARFEQLGVLERLHAKHDVPLIYMRWRILGHELAGPYTPIDGHELGMCVRRVALDAVLVDWAVDAGAELCEGRKVTELIGAGTAEDPVRGVQLGNEEIAARWVIGADGRASTIANLLRLEKTNPVVGEQSYLFSYWRGLPANDFASLDVNDAQQGLMCNPCEDGFTLLSIAGPVEMTRGSHDDREEAYAHGIRAFPESFDPDLLDAAERVSDLVVVPETMMRGFFRQANGPGWVLVGDSGHFKHPGTAQGISDALEQAIYVADALAGSDPDLGGYEHWRNRRSKGFYEWSFVYGSWPNPDTTHPYMRGLSTDGEAVQDWLDTFTRLKRPSQVNTPERLGRWFSAPDPAGVGP